ncbi:hypothetical protein FM037_23980 [Shewanella psychropiezotolerans]|uniref:Winged helix-turn helix domain-containing protein n=1 Tax=Shewanella psychropiezotolerans TaxID=2593655 RepID=A0ABX5X337_9GAMM|nr:hypothetical protein [Shewanella sp. YLB-07]QDO85763.1 hypothetical protein FM037_23980 [Shewanella psychropiezotolerans]
MHPKLLIPILERGLVGLDHKTSPGRPPALSAAQSRQLSAFIEARSLSETGGRLSAHDINEYLFKHFGIHYELSSIYRALKRLGFSWITSRSKHLKQSLAAQEAFKKLPPGNDP